ncbi:hypothetical protein ACI1P2_13330 [Paenibacillus sp. p-8]
MAHYSTKGSKGGYPADGAVDTARGCQGIKKTPNPHTISIVRDESYRGTTLIRSRFATDSLNGLNDLKDNGLPPIAPTIFSRSRKFRSNNSGALKGCRLPPVCTNPPAL